MADDEQPKVTRLPVGFKAPPQQDGQSLKVVDRWDSRQGCNHQTRWVDSGGGLRGRVADVTYLIREGETEVECGNCGTKLDPVWVLLQLARHESNYNRKREIAAEEMKRLRERERTQCEHCGKMTKISGAKARPRQ
jgi:hypothetical protein